MWGTNHWVTHLLHGPRVYNILIIKIIVRYKAKLTNKLRNWPNGLNSTLFYHVNTPNPIILPNHFCNGKHSQPITYYVNGRRWSISYLRTFAITSHCLYYTVWIIVSSFEPLTTWWNDNTTTSILEYMKTNFITTILN